MQYSMVAQQEPVIKGLRAKWLSLLLCVVSIVITGVLFWINFDRRFWFPISGIHVPGDYASIRTTPTNVINGVQFAAKGYEILVVMCLGAMTLDVYKRHLVKEGVPYGLLTGGYQVSNIKLLASPGFWSSAPRALWLALMLAVSILLGAIVGPASAALIVPKFGLFPIPDAFSNMSLPLYTSALRTEAWPQLISDTTANASTACSGNQGVFRPNCPAGGFSNIYGWISGWKFSSLPNNITFPDPSGQISRRLDMLSNNETGTFFSTPTALTVSGLGQFKSYLKGEYAGKISQTEFYKLELSNSSVNYQPLVNAKCNVWNNVNFDKKTDAPTMEFPSKELNCFGDSTCNQMRDMIKARGWHVPENYWTTFNTSAAFSVINLGNTTSDGKSLSSLVFMGRSPYLSKDLTNKGLRIVACSYMAHWIPSRYWANSTDSEPIATNITDLSIFDNEKKWKEEHPEAVVGKTIGFDDSWLPYLAVGEYSLPEIKDRSIVADNLPSLGYLFGPMQGSYWDTGKPYFQPGSASDPDVGDRIVAEYLEKITGSIITDALARTRASTSVIVAQSPDSNGTIPMLYIGSRGNDTRSEQLVFKNNTYLDIYGIRYPYTGTPQDYLDGLAKNGVTMSFEAKRYGYGYGLPSGSLIFAYAVLTFYIVVVIVYWVMTLIFRADTVTALVDLQELLILAWRSHPPAALEERQLTTVEKDLRQETVAVRATSNSALALVVKKDRQEKPLVELEKRTMYW